LPEFQPLLAASEFFNTIGSEAVVHPAKASSVG